jgi:hypothetical protein
VTKPSEAAGRRPTGNVVAASRGRDGRHAKGLVAQWQERPPHAVRRHPHRLLAVLCWLAGCGRGCSASISYTPAALLTRPHHHTKPYRCRRNIHHNLLRRCSQAQRCFLFTTIYLASCLRNNHLIPLVPSATAAARTAEPTTRPSLPWLASTPPLPPRSTPLSSAIYTDASH